MKKKVDLLADPRYDGSLASVGIKELKPKKIKSGITECPYCGKDLGCELTGLAMDCPHCDLTITICPKCVYHDKMDEPLRCFICSPDGRYFKKKKIDKHIKV